MAFTVGSSSRLAALPATVTSPSWLGRGAPPLEEPLDAGRQLELDVLDHFLAEIGVYSFTKDMADVGRAML